MTAGQRWSQLPLPIPVLATGIGTFILAAMSGPASPLAAAVLAALAIWFSALGLQMLVGWFTERRRTRLVGALVDESEVASRLRALPRFFYTLPNPAEHRPTVHIRETFTGRAYTLPSDEEALCGAELDDHSDVTAVGVSLTTIDSVSTLCPWCRDHYIERSQPFPGWD